MKLLNDEPEKCEQEVELYIKGPNLWNLIELKKQKSPGIFIGNEKRSDSAIGCGHVSLNSEKPTRKYIREIFRHNYKR